MLPEHVDPLVFLIVAVFAVVFTTAGLAILYITLRVRKGGIPARFRVADFAIHADSEGVGYSPVYEVLDGPRKGAMVTPGTFGKSRSGTILKNGNNSKEEQKLLSKIGQERKGWVHSSDDKGMTLKDSIGAILSGLAFLTIGVGAIFIAIRMLVG